MVKNMKIKKMKVENFQGLKGFHEFEFDKVTALIQSNASGKTSLINALRFGLSGFEPRSEVITKGTSSAIVCIEFESGNYISRQKYNKSENELKYFIQDNEVSLEELNRCVSDELGVMDVSMITLLTSGELLASIHTKKLENLFLQYLPREMKVETLIKECLSVNKAQQDIIRECLPNIFFTTSDLNDFYKTIFRRRDSVRQVLLKKTAVLDSLAGEPPKYKLDEIKSRIEEVEREKNELIKNQAILSAYNKTYELIQERDKELARIEKEMSTLSGYFYTEEEKKLIQELLDNAKVNLEIIQKTKFSLSQTKGYLDSAIEKISKSEFPLSDEKNPSQDKTSILQELKEQRGNLVKDYFEQCKAYEDAKNNVTLYEKKQADMAIGMDQYAKIQELEGVRTRWLVRDLVLPEKPEINGSIDEFDQELSNLKQWVKIIQIYNEKEALENKVAELQVKFNNYDDLVKLFSSKGEIKEKLVSYYMYDFFLSCNKKANELFSGMSLKFVIEDGIKILVNTKVVGDFLEFNALSGGEKASVLFLMVNMLSSLSGLKMIVLDELSVLDNQVFNSLLNILKENQGEYDLCLIAAVDHLDTIQALQKNNISILNIGHEYVIEQKPSQDENVNPQSKQIELPSKKLKNEEIALPKETKLNLSANKLDRIAALKDLVSQTLTETADKRYIPENNIEDLLALEDDFNEEMEEQMNGFDQGKENVVEDDLEKDAIDFESLGLTKSTPKKIINYIKENIAEDGYFNKTGKDIAETLDFSQPTVARVLKKLQEVKFLIPIRRGVWKVLE